MAWLGIFVFEPLFIVESEQLDLLVYPRLIGCRHINLLHFGLDCLTLDDVRVPDAPVINGHINDKRVCIQGK